MCSAFSISFCDGLTFSLSSFFAPIPLLKLPTEAQASETAVAASNNDVILFGFIFNIAG
jgi:hypothetical protein